MDCRGRWKLWIMGWSCRVGRGWYDIESCEDAQIDMVKEQWTTCKGLNLNPTEHKDYKRTKGKWNLQKKKATQPLCNVELWHH